MKETKKLMEDSLQHFLTELKNLRTGRPAPGMLDEITVEIYGSQMNLKGVATVSVADGRQLVVSPFDPQTASSIAKAIEKANMNLQAIVDGNVIRVPVPPLSEDMRKDIVKQGKKKAEDAKVSIREIRKKANNTAKQKKADGDLTEDQVKRMEKDIQKLTDDYCKEIDAKFAEKEKDILTV
ncbi:MAG: ribosome recycling factor [Rhabdochlamydiaceae bacterium]|nr:ribosome recycling factor [Candidatus Amphrikana amoebophyrae]